MCADFTREPGNNFSSWQNKSENVSIKRSQTSRLPSQLFPFPSLVLLALENDAAKGKTRETSEYKLSKAMIQNGFYGTHAVPTVWGALVSTVCMLYHPSWRV